MTIIHQLASARGRSDEELNIKLAKSIVNKHDESAIEELVAHLTNGTRATRHDVIKVLYEVGYLEPGLIAEHVAHFLALLSSRDNRMVWGAMTALGTMVSLRPDEIWKESDKVMEATRSGSVITQDWGIRVLSAVAKTSTARRKRIFPFLLDFLGACSAKDVPRHAESIAIAVDAGNATAFTEALQTRVAELGASGSKRVLKVLKQLSKG